MINERVDPVKVLYHFPYCLLLCMVLKLSFDQLFCLLNADLAVIPQVEVDR